MSAHSTATMAAKPRTRRPRRPQLHASVYITGMICVTFLLVILMILLFGQH
jgi:hypothetical protein